MPLPQLITITPSPIPSVPCWVLVCYDFSGGATSPVTLAIAIEDAKHDHFETEVSAEEPCVRVYMPAGSTGITVVDSSGQSQDQAAQVHP